MRLKNIFLKVRNKFLSNYSYWKQKFDMDTCYSNMEYSGVAVFGNCIGESENPMCEKCCYHCHIDL